MTAASLLSTLRARGYTVTLLYSGEVVATGPTPKDPERAKVMLSEHQDELAKLLRAEQRQEVQDAAEVLGAVLLRATDGLVPAVKE